MAVDEEEEEEGGRGVTGKWEARWWCWEEERERVNLPKKKKGSARSRKRLLVCFPEAEDLRARTDGE